MLNLRDEASSPRSRTVDSGLAAKITGSNVAFSAAHTTPSKLSENPDLGTNALWAHKSHRLMFLSPP